MRGPGRPLVASVPPAQRDARRGRYAANREYELDYHNRRVQSRRRFVAGVKSWPCEDCGVSYPSCVMDLDHRGDKLHPVAAMVSSGFSLAKITTEIMKCDLVCSNCHRLRTAERRPA